MRPSTSCLLPLAVLPAGFAGQAQAQTSFIGADGHSHYPGVTMLCPNGLRAVPCNFGGTSTTLSIGGSLVSASNPMPVSLSAGQVSLGGVSQSGSWSVGVNSLPALPAGSNAIGSVSVSNFPGTQTVAGAVSENGAWNVGVTSLPALPAGNNALGSVSVSNLPGTQSVAGTLAVSSLPALPAGSNAIGSVSVSNLPATQIVTGSIAQSGSWSVGVASLPALPAGNNAIGSVSVSNLPGTQSVSGSIAQAGSWSVGVSSLPALPAGSNAIGSVSVSNLPATQPITGSVTLTGSNTVTLSSNTMTLAAGSSSIGTVTTVPSANNVPTYLQAVTSGGATPYSAVNAASSCMATSVKSSTGMVFDYAVSNSGTSPVWVRFFASGSAPSCGAGTPVKRLYVPAGGSVALDNALGWAFSGGIGFDVTSGSGADTDSTVVGAASTVLVNIDYK